LKKPNSHHPEFYKDKCDDTMAAAQEMIESLNKKPILGEAAVEAGEE
jgi:hypothetical protein